MDRIKQIKAELKVIEKKKGLLNPHDVVKFAENPKTALHSCFTWDDGIAAEQWRLHEARNLIRVIVEVIPNENNEIIYRAFISLPKDRHNEGGYRSIGSVLSNEELRKQLLNQAMLEMKSFKKKYQDLNELCEVFTAMKKVLTKSNRTDNIKHSLSL